MGFLKDMVQRFKSKSQKEKELEEDIHIQGRVQQKMKSANERELEGYLKENRERQIEKNVKRLREQKSREMWKANLIKNNPKAYINDSILRERKMFLRRNATW